jgi:hypothetical protein
MPQFKINEEAYNKYAKKWTAIIIAVACLIVLVVVLANALSSPKTDVITLVISALAATAFVGFSVYRALKKQKQVMLNYSVTISDSEIIREQVNTPPLAINFMEIKEILKSKKGGFTIKGLTRTDVIIIPYLIDDRESLEQSLERLAPITVETKIPFSRKYRLLLTILFPGLMIATFLATNKIIAGLCGLVVIGLLAWSLYNVQTSKNVPENTKRRSWVYLLLIASFIYLIYSKFTGTL